MRPHVGLTDQQILSEISDLRKARRKIATGDIAVIAGEGRRLEYGRGDSKIIDQELRELYAEATERGMAIGAGGGAIAVEIG